MQKYSFEDYPETGDIATELEKLGNAGVFPDRTTKACVQGAWIMRRLREVVFTERDPAIAIRYFKEMLMKHHDG